MAHPKRIALVAHMTKKHDLIEWAKANRDLLMHHDLYAMEATAPALERDLGIPVQTFKRGEIVHWAVTSGSAPGSHLDAVIFFWNHPESLPHDPDARALLRLATLWNIPMACNRASADCLVLSSVLPRAAQQAAAPAHERSAA